MWNKKFNKYWKPLLQTKGQWNEQKIKNELHDLDFVVEQVGTIYYELTGGLLSKPMYYAQTILSEHNERFLDKGITQDDIKMFIKDSKSKEDLAESLEDYFEIKN